MERAADAAAYQVFRAALPSAQYHALIARLRKVCDHDHKDQWHPRSERAVKTPGLRELLAAVETRTILHYSLGKAGHEAGALEGIRVGNSTPIVTSYDPASSSSALSSSARFDAVLCTEVLEYLPDEDVPWMLEEFFRCANRLVCITITTYPQARVLPDVTRLPNRPRDASWWLRHVEEASSHHPAIHWKLVLQTRTALGCKVARVREGGLCFNGPPTVWVLTDDHPGNTSQSVGLAQALGWRYEVKELRFTKLVNLYDGLFGAFGATRLGLNRDRSASLAPPWPDLVIATGWRTAHVARWVHRQSRDRTRLVQLGRKGGHVADRYDAVVSCEYFRLPPHPRRIEIVAPLTPVIHERLQEAAERWQGLFAHAPYPRIALLVGGTSRLYRLDAETARRMGEEVGAFARNAGGFVFATTSRRTGEAATAALGTGLGEASSIHTWQPGQQDNPYFGYLALADVLVVTGDSESMLGEAVATGKPVYIYPLPERQPSLRTRLKELVVGCAQKPPLHQPGTAQRQGWLAYLCARLIERGVVLPPNDLNRLHQTLSRWGMARFFGEPLVTEKSSGWREIDDVARWVRARVGLSEHTSKTLKTIL
jgi:hypothetical protein